MSAEHEAAPERLGAGMPAGFLWGAATAAYQIEGAVAVGGRGLSNWDEFSRRPNKIYRGDTGDIAADHYHHLQVDLDLMAELGIRAYRFSISWSRIMPDASGTPNPAGLAFYKRLIQGLISRGIKPMPTIVHMELPLWLEQRGGWMARETVEKFVDYAMVLHEAFADRVRHWCTLNEAVWVSWLGYGADVMPPGANQPRHVLPAMHHQLLAHGLAARAMRAADGDRKNAYGIVGSWWPARAATARDADVSAAAFVDDAMNRITTEPLFKGRYPPRLLEWHEGIKGRPFIEHGDLEAIQHSSDFYGLNYYAPIQVEHDPTGGSGTTMPPGLGARQVDPPNAKRTAMGWVIEADGLYSVLHTLQRDYQIPIYITENGAAVDDYVSPEREVNDFERIDYLRKHIAVIEQAIQEGVDVRGYMLWSLMDNFEWTFGYSKRFGLVYIDYGSQIRTPKKSFHWYKDLIARWLSHTAAALR